MGFSHGRDTVRAGLSANGGALMRMVRIGVAVIGVLMALVGLLWMGQGSGYFPYPAGNFIIDQRPWILRGAVLLLAGIGVVWYSRRL